MDEKSASPQDEVLDLNEFHNFDSEGRAKSVIHAAVCGDIKKKHRLVVIDGTFYEYIDGFYEKDCTGNRTKSYIKRRIFPHLQKATVINQIYTLLIDDYELERKFSEMNQFPVMSVPFLDGILDPLTGELTPHREEHYCLNKIPFRWADCRDASDGEEIEKFLTHAILNEDDLEMALEFFGLCFTRYMGIQKLLFLVGQGGAGKSTLLNLLKAALGEGNYSCVELDCLGERFMGAQLLGRTANICADLKTKALTETATQAMKVISGEDEIFCEEKGRRGFFLKPYCKMVFSTNSLPRTTGERTNAVFRRLLVVETGGECKKPDPGLSSRLEKHIPYFIQLCMMGLRRLCERREILVSENSKLSVAQLRRDSDSVEAFLDECCTVGTGQTERGRLFRQYDDFCKKEERTPLSRNRFYAAMRERGNKDYKTGGEFYFKNIIPKTALPGRDDFDILPLEEMKNVPF